MTAHPLQAPPAYAGGRLDRAPGLRADPARLAALLEDAATRVIPLWRDRCLLRDAGPLVLTRAAAGLLTTPDRERAFLGLDGNAALFAVDLSALDETAALALAGADTTGDVRHLVGTLERGAAATLAYARGLLHWHRGQRFCGSCGAPTASRQGGHARACTRGECGRLFFPRIEPAVIVLVEAPGPEARCLLGRHRGAAPEAWAALAGFVEVGESLEDAVRREVAEEAGLAVDAIAYEASQPWPFPAGLMVGYRARAAAGELRPDRDELEEARWFTREELAALLDASAGRPGVFNPDSIERHLIQGWLRGRP